MPTNSSNLRKDLKQSPSNTAIASPKPLAMTPGSLRDFIAMLEREHPEQIVHVTEPVDPANFDVTAVLKHLELDRKFPLVVFDRPLNLFGKPSEFPIATNIYATRERCAMALDLRAEDATLGLSLEYARREQQRRAPQIIASAEAPVKQVVTTGEAVDLRVLPIIRHHEMDAGPYIDMTSVMRDPDNGTYNVAFLRNMYKGPRKLGLHMSPRHNWQIHRKNEERNQPTPVAIVVSHHPAFYVGALNVAAFGIDDYALIGGILQCPLRLVPSATLGNDFLIPADAEIVIEGHVLPNVHEVEGPFGEFPGTYGPQRVRWVVEVRALQHRRDAIYQDIFVGHPDNWVLGSFPKEGSVYNAIKGVVPSVRAVHLPASAVGRFHCYISIDKKVDGESKQAALIALGTCDFIKHVFVVDGDIDVYREEEVWWAIATRVQADEHVDIIKNVKGNTLDPSQRDDIMGTKMIVDATKPVRRPFEARIQVPEDALKRIDIKKLIPPEQLKRI